MYKIVRCSQVDDEVIFNSFVNGFADYPIKMEMTKEIFFSRFFGPEGNTRDHSFIAIKDTNAIGICLGGLKRNEEIKTMRCGGMAVLPEYRGKSLAKDLMDYHILNAKSNTCRQVFLEVIDDNCRAINFYKKLGYEKVYDLTYRNINKNALKTFVTYECDLREITLEESKKMRSEDQSHLLWQNSFEYYEAIPTKNYGIYIENKLIASIVSTKKKIIYLYVLKDYRRKGYGSILLNKVITDVLDDESMISYSNNALLHTFCNYLNLGKSKINQIEMYKHI